MGEGSPSATNVLYEQPLAHLRGAAECAWILCSFCECTPSRNLLCGVLLYMKIGCAVLPIAEGSGPLMGHSRHDCSESQGQLGTEK